MKGSKQKRELMFYGPELGNYLRQMANAVEGRPLDGQDDLEELLSGYSKIEMKIKRKKEKILVRLKIVSAAIPEEAAAEKGRDVTVEIKPRYKKLKKQMKSDFKAISLCISKGEFPDALTVKSFIADAESMMGFPGNGNEYYPAFREALIHFSEAFDNRNFELTMQAHTRLKQLRNECHERYK